MTGSGSTSVFRCQGCGAGLGEGLGGLCPECEAAERPELSQAGAVAQERACLRCGYSLRALAVDGVCPECGTAVADSLRGNLLRYSSPEYLSRLHRGAFLAEAAVVVTLLAVVGIIIAGLALSGLASIFYPLVALISALIPLAYAGLTLAGWWLLSSPDPSLIGEDKAERVRRTLRGSLIAIVVATVVLVFLGLQTGGFGFGLVRAARVQSPGAFVLVGALWLGAVVAWVVVMVSSMRYLRMLAARLPDEALAGAARRVLILLGVLAVLAIGPEVLQLVSYATGLSVLRVPRDLAIPRVCGTFLLGAVVLLMYGNLMRRMREMLRAVRGLPRRK